MAEAYYNYTSSKDISGTTSDDTLNIGIYAQGLTISLGEGNDVLVFKSNPKPVDPLSSFSSSSSTKGSGLYGTSTDTTEGETLQTSAATIQSLKKTDIYAATTSSIDLGEGLNNLLTDNAFLSTSISSGSGDDFVKGYSKEQAGGFLDSSINLGNGNNVLLASYIQNLSSITEFSKGDQTLVTGNGNDNISLNNKTFTPLANAEVVLGEGNNVLTADSEKTAVYNSNIESGKGNDYYLLSGGAANTSTLASSSIDAGDGDNTIKVKGNISDSKIKSGSGSDKVINYSSNSGSGINITLLSVGPGSDTINATYINSSIVDTGSGNSIIDITNNSNLTSIYKSTILGGSDDDSLYASSFKTNSIADSTINLKDGNDTLFAINQVANSKIDLGDGNNTLEVYADPSTSLASLYKVELYCGDQQDAVVLQNGINYSQIDLGKGNDYLEIFQQKDGYTAISNSNIVLGEGDDGIFISADSISDLDSSISGGDGIDTIIIDKYWKNITLKLQPSKGLAIINGQDFSDFEVLVLKDKVVDLTKKKNNILTATSAPSAKFKTTDLQVKSVIENLSSVLEKQDLSTDDFDYEFSQSWNKLKNLGSISEEVFKYLDWSQLIGLDQWEEIDIFSGEDKKTILSYSSSNSSKGNLKSITYNGAKFQISTQASLASNENELATQKSVEYSSNYQFLLNGITVTSIAEYYQLDWSKLKIGEYSAAAISEIDWSLVDIKNVQAAQLKKVDWSAVNFASFSAETYSALDWSLVNPQVLSSTQKADINWDLVPKKQKIDWGLITYIKNDTIEEEVTSIIDQIGLGNTQYDWSDISFSEVSIKSKKYLDWSSVVIGGEYGAKESSLSETDKYQIKLATSQAADLIIDDWSKIHLGEFSSKTYASTDWSLVKFGDVTTESKKTMDWSKVSDGFLTNESKTTTDDFQWSINNDTAASGKLSKKTKWNKVNIGEFSTETYSAMDWSQVNIGKFQKFGSTSIDWTAVQFGEFQTKQYKQTNWSQVNLGDFTAEDYSEINWGQVAFKGAKSVNYSALDWSQVDFGDFSAKTFKQVDWSQVKTADLTEQQYSDINWSQVKFKGSKAPTLSDLDLSLVIGSSTFSKKNAKQIDWTQVSSDDLSSSALSKLSGLGVKKKGVNVAELLKPGTQSKELSFAGVGQEQGGALTTGLESSGSGAQVLLGAVEKEPVLV